MIDSNYLIKFGEDRYKNFSQGSKLPNKKLFENSVDKVSMKFLKNLENCEAWSSFMYDLYYYSEMIQRVDFFSKYYLHTLIPKARNLDTIKVLLVFDSYMYAFNPLKDQIEIYEQEYFINLDKDKMYLVILNDNRKLQEYYGEFHLMLSMLNTGHTLFNIEYVLKGYNQKIKYIDTKEIRFNRNIQFVSIPIVMELEMHNHKINFEKQIHGAIENDYFLKRSSAQNISGDSVIKKKVSEVRFKNLAEEILKVNRKENVHFVIYVDNIENFESGYYSVDNNSLNLINGKSSNDINKLLYEFQEFTNIDGMIMWVFFYTDRNTSKEDSSQFFIDLGYMAQEFSILATKYNLAARAMKNYNDLFIKENFKLNEHDFVGYSLALFPKLNYGHSVLT